MQTYEDVNKIPFKHMLPDHSSPHPDFIMLYSICYKLHFNDTLRTPNANCNLLLSVKTIMGFVESENWEMHIYEVGQFGGKKGNCYLKYLDL